LGLFPFTAADFSKTRTRLREHPDSMSTLNGSTLIPSLRYRDAPAAIDWLVRAFGFQKQAVYPGPNSTVAHAQLTYGAGMIMLGSVDNGSEIAKLMVQPDEIGLRETKGIYLVVPDADAVHAIAQAAGAEMVLDIRDMDYGGRAFTCRDLEGHLWSIGTYDPWKTENS
jgi:uncharacterized glyoxalase superfamily protein PhnB